MDAGLFTASAWGTLVSTAQGNPAFVPAAPPRRLDLGQEVVTLLDEASHRLGVLSGIGQRLPNPHLLIAPYLRREALLSSRIEGTQTTLAEVYAAEAEQLQFVPTPDIREVVNYVEAYEYGLGRLATLPLSLRLLRELHERLMAGGVRGGGTPGEFRTYQNFIGGTSETDATYVGPPVPEMRGCLDELEAFMHDRSLPPLVQAAVLHYAFEAIHAFGDGNGRVGRLLNGLFLHERELLSQPLLYLSAYFEGTVSTYYELLMRVSTHGDWDTWLNYFLRGVRDQAADAARLADALLSLQSAYRERLQVARATTNVMALSDQLFVTPVVTTASVQRALGVTAPTARASIRALEQHEILHERTGRKWRRIYDAREVLDLLRGPD